MDNTTKFVSTCILAASLGACSNQTPTYEVVSTQHTVPALEYTVQRGDAALDLTEERMDGFRRINGGLYMNGDATNVVYQFGDEDPFLRELSRGVDSRRDPLMLYAGEKVIAPDYDGDGKINGQVSRRVGVLVYTGRRIPQLGDATYNPSTIEKKVDYYPDGSAEPLRTLSYGDFFDEVECGLTLQVPAAGQRGNISRHICEGKMRLR